MIKNILIVFILALSTVGCATLQCRYEENKGCSYYLRDFSDFLRNEWKPKEMLGGLLGQKYTKIRSGITWVVEEDDCKTAVLAPYSSEYTLFFEYINSRWYPEKICIEDGCLEWKER